MESYEFQAVGPRTEGAVVARLPRQIAFDGERKCPREEEARYGHQSLEALSSLLPQIACVEIKLSLRVSATAESWPPRHGRDACSMAWRCRFLTARPNDCLISTQQIAVRFFIGFQ